MKEWLNENISELMEKVNDEDQEQATLLPEPKTVEVNERSIITEGTTKTSKRKRKLTDEVKAAENRAKRLSASLVHLLDDSEDSTRMNVIMDMLRKTQTKVDNTYDIVETLLNCKYCLRRSYKRLDAQEHLTADNISPRTSSKTSSFQKKLSEFSFVEHHQTSSASGHNIESQTALLKPSSIEVHSVPLQDGSVTGGSEAELEIVSASETDLVYVGESLFGIKTSRKALERAEKRQKLRKSLP